MTGSPDGSAQLSRARALVELGRFDAALSELAGVVASDPDNVQARCLLSQALLGANRPAEALTAAQHAIALSPDDEWPHRLASIAHHELGDRLGEVAHAREAARLAPFSWRSLVRLSEALSDGQNSAEANAVAARAVELAPHEAATHSAVGTAAAAAHRYDEATDAYRRALSLDPHDAVTQNNMARVSLARNSARPTGLAAAAVGFSRALGTDPTLDVSRKNLELVLRRFLSRTAYYLFVVAYIGGRAAGSFDGPVARSAPVVLLAAPVWFGWRFVSRLDPAVRRHLLTVANEPWLRAALAFAAVAAGSILASAAVSTSSRQGLLGVALAAALISRVCVWLGLLSRRSDPSSRPRRGRNKPPAGSGPSHR